MAEEEFRGVCREALMANLNGSPVYLEDLEGELCAMELSSEAKERILEDEKRSVRERSRDWEVNSLRVAPFPPDNLGAETPLLPKLRPAPVQQVKRRSPDAIRERSDRSGDRAPPWEAPVAPVTAPSAPSAPVSLLPAPSAAHQMPVPGGDLPPVLLLEGFRIPKLNQVFHFNNQIMVCGFPTYWDRDRTYFVYFHRQDQRWVVSLRDTLAQAQSGVMLGCAFQYVDDVWTEFHKDEWQKAPQVRVTPLVEQATSRTPSPTGAQPLPSRTVPRPPPMASAVPASADVPYSATNQAKPLKQAPFAVDTVHIRGGFLNPNLNAVYHMDSTVQVGSRATYWDDQRRFFMYYQATMKRWAISIRIHDAKTGEDMLEHARRGGLCGFAFEVDKVTNQWKEFFEGRWVSVQIDIQKLCTGKRAPAVGVAPRPVSSDLPPPETPLPMAVQHELPPTMAAPAAPAPHMAPPSLAAPAPYRAAATPIAPASTMAPPTTAAPAPSTAAASLKPAAPAPSTAAPATMTAPAPVHPTPAPKISEQQTAHLAKPEAKEPISEAKLDKDALAVEALKSKETSESESQEKRKKRKKDGKEDDHKAEKRAKKLEKEERARRKENKLKEKIRQEMLAARANKPSSNTKVGDRKKPSETPKKGARKVRDSLKSKKERKKAKAGGADGADGADASTASSMSASAKPKRRRWKAAIAKKWPDSWTEDDPGQGSSSPAKAEPR